MNMNQSRLTPDEWRETARLVSLDEADFPAGRHAFHREELMNFIDQDTRSAASATTPTPAPTAPARRRGFMRPLIVIPAAACSLAVIAAGVVTLTGSSSGHESLVAARRSLHRSVREPPRVSRSCSTRSRWPRRRSRLPTVRAGQYIYIESQVGTTYEKTVDDKTTVVSDGIHRRQTWRSTDGAKGWLIDPAVFPPGGGTIDHINEKGEIEPARLGGPSYDYLATLTTDPDTLLAKIYKETKGQGNSPDQQAFTTIGDLLNESMPPPTSTSPCSRPRPRSPAWSWSRTPWTQPAATAWPSHGSTRPPAPEPNGSSTPRATPTWVSAPSRSAPTAATPARSSPAPSSTPRPSPCDRPSTR